MQIEDLVFRLIRAELWNETFTGEIGHDDFIRLMDLAREQTINGLIVNGLSQSNYQGEEDLMFKFISRSVSTQRKNTSINHELVQFVTFCEKKGLDYRVVKGQVIGVHYPHPQFRTSGDVDFLIKDYPQAKDIFEKKLRIRLPEKMLEKEINFSYNGILYELHTQLIVFGSKRNNRYWAELISQAWAEEYTVTVEGAAVKTLPPVLDIVYIFCHLFFHFVREGVGLRQLCDLAVQLHYYKDIIDKQQLAEILRRLDLTKAFIAFGAVLTDKIGLPAEEFPMTIDEQARRWEDSIVSDIFRGGNFGKKNHKAKNTWKFKIETTRILIRNVFKYYTLAPTEMRFFVPKLVLINTRLALNI